MYRLTKNDSWDIGMAVSALLDTAITWEEFQAWLDHVVMVSEIDDLPGYIFHFLGCKSLSDMWESRPEEVIGFDPRVGFDPSGDLEDESKEVFWGIAYARNQLGLPKIHSGVLQRIVSREEAAAALARHPDVVEWFERFFEAIGKPGELSRGE